MASLPAGRRSILAAVSGGADSIALLTLLAKVAHGGLEAAHVDYRLRGRASTADRLLVERACERWSVPLWSRATTAREVAWLRDGDLQRKARELRYAFFRETLDRRQLDWLATGHHRDDQLETFFLRLFRGAGPRALSGMKAVDPVNRLFRPLLEFPSAELRRYLEGLGLPFRDDATNRTPAYARNRVRLELLPMLEASFGAGALTGVLRSMSLLSAEEEVVAALAEKVRPEPRSDGGLEFRAAALTELPPALGRRAVLGALAALVGGVEEELSLARVDAVLGLASGHASGKRVLFAGVEATREKAELVLRRAGPVAGLLSLELPVPGRVEVPELSLEVVATVRRRPPVAFDAGWLAAELAALELPLLLRHPAGGDRIAPLGMGGHTRSLARCLMDRGLGRAGRRLALVLADGKGPIWVAGQVASERIRVTERSGPVVVVRLRPLARAARRRRGGTGS